MKSLKTLSNKWVLKIQSSKNDKLSNIINAIQHVRDSTFKVTKTSQLFASPLHNSLVSFISVESNSSEIYNVINNISKVNNGKFRIDILPNNDRSNTDPVINIPKIDQSDSVDSVDTCNTGLKRIIGILRKESSIMLDTNRSYLMGIVNCTNDSFSEGGSLKNYKSRESLKDYFSILEELEKNHEFYDIIDIGGESTRPGSIEIDPNEELERVLPLLRMIKDNITLKNKIISIDTRKSLVAETVLKEGADIINDISGGKFDNNMYKIVSKANCPYICMHMRGDPKTMSSLNKYNDIGKEVIRETQSNLEACWDNNILNFNIWVDPGFGFSKIGTQNYSLLNQLSSFREAFENPMVVGTSRKSFIKRVVGDDTRIGDGVVSGYCVGKGVDIIRCHDVKGIRGAVQVAERIYKYPYGESS